MPVPCCPKCSKTHFLKSKDAGLKVVFVYCSNCGSVISAIAIRKGQSVGASAPGAVAGQGAAPGGWNRVTNTQTASDDWTTTS